MTIDLIERSTSRRRRAFQAARVRAAAARLAPAKVTDIVLVFGGWGSDQAGQPFAAGDTSSDTGRLIAELRELAAASANNVIVRAYQGSLGSEGPRGEREAIRLIRQNLHPAGKLIIHGYSAGGFSALRLCYSLGMSRPYFTMERRNGITRRDLMPYVHYRPDGSVANDRLVGFVRVDSLTIIDAAAGPASSFNLFGATQRRAWPSVRRCLNYYQTHPSPVYSHGGPVVAVDPNVTTVENHNLSDRYGADPEAAHGRIDKDAMRAVVRRIRAELSV